jgi:serine/threonine-protein kinase
VPRPARRPGAWRWWLWLVIGVAATGAAGYLVAAVYLFPAPLLPNERQVPRVLDLPEAQARRDLEREGLTAAIAVREPHPTAPAGTVVWQDPPPGVAAPRGSAVRLTLSGGAPDVSVPDVSGYDVETARRLIAAAGLRAEVVDTVTVLPTPSGTVGGTEPAAGMRVPLGGRVLVLLAK